MSSEQETTTSRFRGILVHAHLPTVFVAVSLAGILLDRLVEMNDVRALYFAALLSFFLPLILYWLVGVVSGWRDFGCIFLDFAVSLTAAAVVFPVSKGIGYLLFSGIILAAAFAVTVAGERRRAKRREAYRRTAATAAANEPAGMEGAPSPSSGSVRGTSRLEAYMAEARPERLPLRRRLLLGSLGFLLVVGIEFLYLLAVRGLVASPDYRTRYATYLVIIVLPAVLYWAVDYTAGPARAQGLFVQTLLALGVLALLIPAKGPVFQLLWYPPACFGLAFFLVRVDRKRRLRRYAGILSRRPPAPIREEGRMKEGKPRPARGSARSAASSALAKRCYSIYSIFRFKKS